VLISSKDRALTRIAVVWGVLVRVMDNESSFVQEVLGADADARKEHIPVVLVKKGSGLDSPAHGALKLCDAEPDMQRVEITT
jgi:hypothetical protein